MERVAASSVERKQSANISAVKTDGNKPLKQDFTVPAKFQSDTDQIKEVIDLEGKQDSKLSVQIIERKLSSEVEEVLANELEQSLNPEDSIISASKLEN